MDKVQLPDEAIHGDDLLSPLQDLLRGLNVLPKLDKDGNAVEATLWATPQSVAVLEAGAPNVVKAGTAIATLLGGAGITAASVGGFWGGLDISVQRTVVTALAIVGAVGILAVAAIVIFDVRMRLRGSLAIYDLRKAVAMSFVDQAVATSAKKAEHGKPEDDGRAAAEAAHSALVIALAAARSQVAVRCGDTEGRLTGLVEDNGSVKVKFESMNGQKQERKAPKDLHLLHLNY
jgi:hypothetical protein